MIAGLSGSLLSHDALENLLAAPGGWPALRRHATTGVRLRSWYAATQPRLGPASSARMIFDLIAEPLMRALGFAVIPLESGRGAVDAILTDAGGGRTALTVAAWGTPPAGLWRHAVHLALGHGARWCLVLNGAAVRIIDARRTFARRHAEFDLAAALDDERALGCFCAVLGAPAETDTGTDGPLGEAVASCERHRAEVRVNLRDGVQAALLRLVGAFRGASRRQSDAVLLHESLTVVYRLLFLLFAESRRLVPRWHPVYEASYTVEALADGLGRGATERGSWETLQAIARLAHRGCRAGALRVPPFNGRLFSPAAAPLADSLPLDDRAVAGAVAALTTRAGPRGRERIAYGDLGVEQLGAVYEHLLDFDLAPGGRRAPAVLIPTGRRKSTGSFYTPRSLTEFLVRRALAPVVQGRTPDQLLALRVLDPAMGSGAFLVAACRYLAAAYESALVEQGTLAAGDIDGSDRAGFRRLVAQRCLFGVDLNPMAVQLGRLSLWLATLSGDRPLTFFDHHLRAGNSLLGASALDIMRQPAPGRRAADRDLPLFGLGRLQTSLEHAVGARLAITAAPDDTIDQVRGKERTLSVLDRPGGPLERWRAAANLWCAAICERTPQPRATFRALLDRVLRDGGPLSERVVSALRAGADDVAAAECFFHWNLEFPEVFFAHDGGPRADAGFDAVIGNPPWEMLRDDGARNRTAAVGRFAKSSGVYRLQGPGHTNLYQLFLERAVQLLRPGGRAGLILPAGFAADSSSARMRRHLFDRTLIDTFTILENRRGIFPIHRGLKFLLLTLTNGDRTRQLPLRPGARSVDDLDRAPDRGPGEDGATIFVSRELVERLGGEDLAVPAISDPRDLEIVTGIAFRVPACGAPEGWNIRFGRELNATDDRPHFTEDLRGGLPVLEGKHLRPFAVDVARSRCRVAQATATRLLQADASFGRRRLAYREVSGASNRMTLIAALVPAGTVTTHTVFCLKTRLDLASQHFLCGVFNSYVANYLVRMRVGSHVTAAIVARMPVPKPDAGSPGFRRIVRLSEALSRGRRGERLARLNAAVAALYGLTPPEYSRVLETFPLVPEGERAASLKFFTGAGI